MIKSVWRYSHFLIAAISAVFLLVASLTGAILAVEPIAETSQPYAIAQLNEVRLSETLKVLQEKYMEVLDLEITPEDFVVVSVITKDGDSKNSYVHPTNGNEIGNVKSQSTFFSFVTNLHRSLFLKSIGRGFIGIVSFLLCFIAVTGVFLLAQRQGGFKRWFTKVQETNFAQRYHVIFGRWFLMPILIIATTGVYLSAEKFSLLPDNSIEHNWSVKSTEGLREMPVSEFPLFQSLTLNEVRKITFPFSEDAEDYFEVALNGKELLVQQYTGEVVSEVNYPFVQLASRWSMQLHTGQGSIIWSIILLLASLSLLFFMFSGLAISLKRLKKTQTIFSEWAKDEAEYILLVGSETGSTYAFAKSFYNALKVEGKKVFQASLNEYTTYEKATHLIVFTATYGDGDAPSNARKFETLLHTIQPKRKLQFSVIGFGSLLYPHYCRFAIRIDALLHSHPDFLPIQPLVKINEQSEVAFINWVQFWNKSTGMDLKIRLTYPKKRAKKEQSFKVLERTSLNVDNTAIVRLRPGKKVHFQSGDLLSVIPPEDTFARQYSIAKIDGDILLSIKWHPKGICSTYLCTLNEGDVISASIEKNIKFHFPKKASSVWLVANGTGIAPYLGMINENNETPVKLSWGGRTKVSFDCYHEILKGPLSRKQIEDYQLVFSQVKDKAYVQDVLLKQKTEVAEILKSGGVFMLCGSMAMQNAVLDTLEDIATIELQQPLSDFENNKQILMDCY